MKKLLLGAAAVVASFAACGAAQADFTLTILHTNDVHSRIEPISKYDSTCSKKDDDAGKCFGGSARVATEIAARKAVDGTTIVLDDGDQFQGSLFYTYYKGKAAAQLMNMIGYDVMSVGNHEFDNGPGTLRGFVDLLKLPLITANVDFSKEPLLAGRIKPSVVIEKGGEKIGVIGLTPADVAELSSPGKNITFQDPIAPVQAEVKKLEGEGVDKIILLSHSGYNVDQHIAAAVSGVDVIVGGHSHTFLSNTSDKAAGPYPTWIENPDGVLVPIVQAASYSRYLGELKVTFDDKGVVKTAEGEPILLDASVKEDPKIKAEVEKLAKPLDEIRQKVVAESTGNIDGARDICRAQECSMGDLVADAMLARTKEQGVEIAFQNGGGVRASIGEGPVTMGEVLDVLPFQNTLATFGLKGSGVLAALENGVSQVDDGAGRFPQVAGLRYTWTRSKPANEGRILKVEVQENGAWVPLDPDKTYMVVSNNFMRTGGDGYKVFNDEGINAYDYGPNLEDVVAEYLAAHTPYAPAVDGRVTEEK